MGLRNLDLDVCPPPRRQVQQTMDVFPMDLAENVLVFQKPLREVAEGRCVFELNGKERRQTVVKVSCDSRTVNVNPPTPAKDDRILLGLETEEEKRDVSKEDFGRLSGDWEQRAVSLYQTSIKNKSLASVLGVGEKRSSVTSELQTLKLEKTTGRENSKTQDYVVRKLKNLEANEKNTFLFQTNIDEDIVDNKLIDKVESFLKLRSENRKERKLTSGCDVVRFPVDLEKWLKTKTDKNMTEKHNGSNNNNNCFSEADEKQKIVEKTVEKNHRNLLGVCKTKAENEAKNLERKYEIANNNTNAIKHTQIGRQPNSKQIKEATNKGIILQDGKAKVQQITLQASFQSNLEKENEYRRAAVIENKCAQDAKDRIEENETKKKAFTTNGNQEDDFRTALENKKLNIEEHCERNQHMLNLGPWMETNSKMAFLIKKMNRKKMSHEAKLAGQPGQGFMVVTCKGDPHEKGSDSPYVIDVEDEFRGPMIDLRAVRFRGKSCADTPENGRAGGQKSNETADNQGNDGKESDESGGGDSNGNDDRRRGDNGQKDGDGSSDKPPGSFEHKDRPGEIENPDRDKQRESETSTLEAGAVGEHPEFESELDPGGKVQPQADPGESLGPETDSEPERVGVKTLSRDPGGAAGNGRGIAPAKPGYVQVAVAHYSPPGTPPRSPVTRRVKAVRGTASSVSPPAQRRSAGNAALGLVKHGSIQALEDKDIYTALGSLISEEEDDRETATVVLQQFNICLPKCLKSNNGNGSDGCTICSLLTSLLKHTGRCILSRGKDGCRQCRQSDVILRYHVENCFLAEAIEEETRGSASPVVGATAAEGLQQRSAASNGACKVVLCRKVREKLRTQKTGRDSGRDLEQLWSSAKLWDAIREHLGKVLAPHVDERGEVTLSMSLDGIGPAAWSDISSRYGSLVSQRGAGTGSDSPNRSTAHRGQVAVGVGGDLMLVSMGGSSHEDQEDAMAQSQPLRGNLAVGVGGDLILLGVGGSDQEDQADSTHSHSTRDVAHKYRHRQGSDTQSITDMLEAGPFSMYMTQGHWEIPAFRSVGLATEGGSERGEEQGATGGGMQPQGIGQRSPEVVYDINDAASERPPVPLFQQTFTSFQPLPASSGLSQEFFLPDSLPVFPVESEGQARVTLGQGHVAYGDRRHLVTIAGYWEELREQFKNDDIKLEEKVWEGIILADYMTTLCIEEGEYNKHVQWERATYLGSGICGKTYLAVDGRSSVFFCVKKVPVLKFQPEEITIWSLLEHKNTVKLFGVLRRGQKIYFLQEFIDGGSLQEHIDEYGGLGVPKALTYFQQILQVLCYLQQKCILHEDLKADNILLRGHSLDLVLADFGLSRQLPVQGPIVPAGENPVGGATQWSPEKAASEGHGFPAEVWASCCVLLHMVTGAPPWIRRYPAAGALHFLIKIQAPPVEDIPVDLDSRVKDVFRQGWNRDVRERWTSQQLLNHSAFHILDERPTPRRRESSLTEVQISSAGGSMNQAQLAAAPTSQSEATAAEPTKLPADKLKDQDPLALAELALSLASEQDEFLASLETRSLTSLRLSSMRAEERIGTPVKVKKSRGKSPTGGEKQPLSVPKQVQRTTSNDSNTSFELDIGALQEAGLLEDPEVPVDFTPEPDEVFHSKIKEPDFESLKLPFTVMATSTPVIARDDVTSGESVMESLEERHASGRVVSRSMLPALSIFNTMSSLSGDQDKIRSGKTIESQAAIHEEVKAEETQPPEAGKARGPVYEAVICQRADGQQAIKPVVQQEPSPPPSHQEHVKLATIGKLKKETSPVGQAKTAAYAISEESGVHRAAPAKSPLADRKARVETSIEISSARGSHLAPPSGHMTASSFEPLDLQERRRIQDFEDLYTARQEGEPVGIGARSKVSTFVPPGIEPSGRQNEETTGQKGKKGCSLVLTSSDVVSSIGNGKDSFKAKTPSPTKESKPPAEISSPTPTGQSSTGMKKSAAFSPESANGRKVIKQTSPSPINESRMMEPVLVSALANKRGPFTLEVGSSPTGDRFRGPVYDEVICQRADRTDPTIRPTDLYRIDAAARGEPEENLYDSTGARKALPPLDVVDEEETAATLPRRAHKSQGDVTSHTLPRDGATRLTDAIGRSISEPAQALFHRPLSAASSQRSLEVEQEYRSLVDDLYKDQWSKSSETSFEGFVTLPHIHDDDSPESVTFSPGTVVERGDEYDFTTSLEWLNRGYLTSAVAGVKISFCDETGKELCSVRVLDTRQQWEDIVSRISAHPAVLQRFPMYTVVTMRNEPLDLSDLVTSDQDHVTLLVRRAGDSDDWLWRVKDGRVEYHTEVKGPFMHLE